MFGWLRKRQRAPLSGAPVVRREKFYSARSGFVYQYVYEGSRPVKAGTEYVFQVSADRKTSFPVSVLAAEEALAAWESAHERRLQPNERYAVAKMALFQAFDEREAPAQMRVPVRLRPADVEAILSGLGID